MAYQTLAVLHNQNTVYLEKMAISVTESGFEPELFKTSFKDGWQNFEHISSQVDEADSEDEIEENS